MNTVSPLPDSDPPPVITPYFESRRRAVDQAAADRGLPYEAWTA
jgi:hypothetical protein